MRILFIGDIVGRPGRRVVKAVVPRLRAEKKLDLVIANVENAAGGVGITRGVAADLQDAGIDVMTSGNHIWDNREGVKLLTELSVPLIRPANYPEGVPGRGFITVDVPPKVLVINLLGRVFLANVDCPFRAADRILSSAKDVKIIVVDFHAEATSEKVAMGWFLDGRASAVLGTHTHVQTADERVLPGGTAYITDVGMCGPIDSIIGMRKDRIIERFLKQIPVRFEVASGRAVFNGVIVEVDDGTGRATSIERLFLLEESF